MTPDYSVDRVDIYQGHVLDMLAALPDESVHCVVTSPPYWGLRDYGLPAVVWPDGWSGSLGLEPTPALYVEHMVAVFREVRRVLRADGTCWLNLGDCYFTSPHGPIGANSSDPKSAVRERQGTQANRQRSIAGLKHKDLVGIPWRVAFVLQDDGWYLRSDIIWHKPNTMPESVTDRPTKAHEYVFLFAKSPHYFYDIEAVKEPNQGPLPWGGRATSKHENDGAQGRHGHSSLFKPGQTRADKMKWSTNGRNRRSVWTIATKPFKGAHFATFPPDLVKPCILAGTSALGVVLDPFAGSGTTCEVAYQLGRRSIGIEMSPEYLKLIAKRLDLAIQQGTIL